jgi:hypothetical protein
MKTKNLRPHQCLYGVAGLVVLSTVLISTWISGCNQNQEQTIAFTNVNLIPMTSETVIEDQTVLVKGSDIIDIGGSNELKISSWTPII